MAVTVAPYVNLNGTAREALVEGYCKAAEALHEALDALHAVAPHGRDYQTAPCGRFRLAEAEHAARVNALSAVYEDLQALAEAVNGNGPECPQCGQPTLHRLPDGSPGPCLECRAIPTDPRQHTPWPKGV